MQERCVARLATAGGQTGTPTCVAGDVELTSLRGWHLESSYCVESSGRFALEQRVLPMGRPIFQMQPSSERDGRLADPQMLGGVAWPAL